MASEMAAEPEAPKRLMQRLADIYELPGPRRIVPFEGLRGLAVLLVFFVHYHAAFGTLFAPGGLTTTVGSTLWSIGHSGVDLFFVLSGFLIYGSLIARQVNYPRYLRRRIERIYPTFLCVLGLYLVLSLIFPDRSKLPPTTGAAVVYVLQNVLLLPGIFAITPIITVAWSLSYEFFFYIVVPVLVGVLALRRRSPSFRIGLILCLAVGYTAGHAIGLPYQHFVLFMTGMLVYDATRLEWRAGQIRGFGWAAVVLAVLAVPSLYALEGHPEVLPPVVGSSRAVVGMLRTALLAGLYFAVVFTCLMPGTRGGRIFSWTPLRWLGNMSYSYYLLHGLTINVTALALSGLGPDPGHADALYWLLLPLTFGATILSSTVLFAIVERPLSLREGRPPREVAAAGLPGRTVASGA